MRTKIANVFAKGVITPTAKGTGMDRLPLLINLYLFLKPPDTLGQDKGKPFARIAVIDAVPLTFSRK